jgi:small-conductance mechanosensitive channel
MSNHRILKLGFDKITAQESKRRLYFVLKLVLFVVLLIVGVRYSDMVYSFGVSERLVKALLFYVPTNLVISFSRLSLVYIYIKKNHRQHDFRDNFILGIDKIAALLSIFSLIITLFLLFNVDVKEFFTSISIVAAAIAITFKDYLSNMINGMIIMFTDQLSLHDDVKIGDHKGTIVNITLLNVHLLNDDDDLIYIPNSAFFEKDVVNYTKHSVNKVSIEFELAKEYAKSISELEEIIKENLLNYANYIKNGSMELKIDKISREAVFLKFQLTLYKRNNELEKEIQQYVSEVILKFIGERLVKV